MTKYSPELQDRVTSTLRELRLTPYDLERAVNGAISHQTIRNVMSLGKVPSSDHIINIVEAIGLLQEWTPRKKRQLADEWLSLVDSRARYFARVRHSLTAHARSVAV